MYNILFKIQLRYLYICSLKLKIMRQIIIYCFIIASSISSVLSQDVNKKYFDKMVGSEILIDQCNRAGLEEGTFGQVFSTQYAEYNPETSTIADLKKQVEGISIKIVFGSWCYDSKMQVPRFMKVLDQIEFNESNLSIIAVDRLKKSHDASIDHLKIKLVPTFIIYKGQEEIGRIVENPKTSLEQDLLKILQEN